VNERHQNSQRWGALCRLFVEHVRHVARRAEGEMPTKLARVAARMQPERITLDAAPNPDAEQFLSSVNTGNPGSLLQ
jgi:Flp pilus assembly CpaF family ATPase